MITNWMPTVAGLCAAIGIGFIQSGEPALHLPGIILSIVGTAMLGIVAKQYNVHGGAKAQATPPEVEAKVSGGVVRCPSDFTDSREEGKAG